jgi:membrane associated rhomboid family serine protease
VLPLGDFTGWKRFPLVTLLLIGANLGVWFVYQLPEGIERSVETLGFRPCGVDGSCPDTGLAWPLEALTSMFTHGSWSHIVGNLVFLFAFGPLVEGLVGPARYALMYVVSGIAADALQGGLTLAFTPDEASIPNVGASGAISGVIGAYVVARPFERVLTWVMPVFFLRIPALGLLGVWFLLQALEGAYSLSNPEGLVGIAFFAHAGGFAAGVVAATLVLPGAWTRKAAPGRRHRAPPTSG